MKGQPACRLALISAAHIHTPSYLEAFRRADDGRQLRAVWDDDPVRGRRHAELAGVRFEPDRSSLLTDPQVDGFLICAENTRHLPLLREILPLGKPVFCEKPLVVGIAEAETLRPLLTTVRTPLICGYFHPFEAELRTIAALVSQQAIGRVTRVRCRIAHAAAYLRSFDHPDVRWLGDVTQSGGGAWIDLGTHAVHWLCTLFGSVVSVWGQLRNESGAYQPVEDHSVVRLEFAGGVWGEIEASWTHTGGPVGLELIGERGAIWRDGGHYVLQPRGCEPEPIVVTEPPRPARIDRLVAAIRGELPADEIASDLELALHAVAVVDAAYKAARSGHWVQVPSAPSDPRSGAARIGPVS